MRVMLLVTVLERGGTPLRIAHYARLLHRAGIAVVVGCLAPLGPVGHELAAEGIDAFGCAARGAWDLRALRRLGQALRQHKPDVLHATLFHANLAARLVGRWCGVPVLTSTATIEVERRWHLTLERLTAGLDRGHLVTSRALADHVHERIGIARTRIALISPSLPARPQPPPRAAARALLGVPAGAFVVAWAGRLDPVKGFDSLLETARRLSAPQPRQADFVFLLAGDGPLRGSLIAAIEKSGLVSTVRLLGWQADLGPLFSAADALLFPSITEGLPNTVLHALAAGVPVVGRAIPALSELAESCAGVVPCPLNDPAAPAKQLHAWREAPAARMAASVAARAWADARLRPETTLQDLLAAYERAK